MKRSQSTGKISAMAKAKTVFHSFSQRAEKLLNEVKAEIRGQEGSTNSQTPANAALKATSPQNLPWSAKNVHEKKHEEEFKRRILEIPQKADEYFGPGDKNMLIDMRAAMTSAGAILEVDENLRALRFKLVPKTMSDQEFWKRYTIAVKRIKQEVLDAAAREDAVRESSLTDSVIISRQESGLEALRTAATQELQEVPVFIPVPIPPSTTVRRLSRAVQVSQGCSNMAELSTLGGDGHEQNGLDGPDTWSSLVSGLQGLKGKQKPKSRTSNTAGAAEYHALLWTLFEADATAEDLASTSEGGVVERPHSFAEDIRGAPVDSFVAQLAEVMAGIKTEQKMAAFWLEVVKQLRKHWVERRPIPRTPVDAQPELYFCNLQQQLELLNCCIARWKRQTAAIEAAKAAATASALFSATEPQPPTIGSHMPENGTRELESGTDRHAAEVSDSGQATPAQTTESTDGSGKQSHENADISRSKEVKAGRNSQADCESGQKQPIREGVDCAVPGVRLLITGEPMYEPVTQEGPILTEDLIRETEELVLKTGSVGHGCKQLLSDMQAFKAANPGCILEDFVRWYSPPDYIQGSTTPKSSRKDRGEETPKKDGGGGEESPVTPPASPAPPSPELLSSLFTPPRFSAQKRSQRGSLSVRMQSEGNLWQELWTSALPVPAVRQAPLFDEELAGETALDELGNISPSDFFEQLFIVALGTGFAVAQASPQAAREPLKSCLQQCATFVIETCDRHWSPAKLERLCQVYETMEKAALLPADEEQPTSVGESGDKEGEHSNGDHKGDGRAKSASNGTTNAESSREVEVHDKGPEEVADSNGSSGAGKKSEDGWTML